MTNAKAVFLVLGICLLAPAASAAKYDTATYAKLKEVLLFAAPCESAPFEWVSKRVSVLKFVYSLNPDTTYMESKSDFVAVFGADTMWISTERQKGKQVFHSLTYKIDAGSIPAASELRGRVLAAMRDKYNDAVKPNRYDGTMLDTSSDCPSSTSFFFSLIEDPTSRFVRVMVIAY